VVSACSSGIDSSNICLGVPKPIKAPRESDESNISSWKRFMSVAPVLIAEPVMCIKSCVLEVRDSGT